jgi:hypothetical protein
LNLFRIIPAKGVISCRAFTPAFLYLPLFLYMNHETYATAKAAFDVSMKEVGFYAPDRIGRSLTGYGQNGTISHELFRAPTEQYLHQGSKETLSSLLDLGDTLCLWTNTYTVQLATAGIGDLRRTLPRDERGRVIISTGAEKLNRLPQLIDYAKGNQSDTIVIVDDQDANLFAAYEAVMPLAEQHIILVRSDQSLQDEKPVVSDDVMKIDRVGELINIRGQQKISSVFWIIDFNNTLLDKRKYAESQLQLAVTLLDRSTEANVITR